MRLRHLLALVAVTLPTSARAHPTDPAAQVTEVPPNPEKRQRFGDAFVYLDGQPIAAVRYPELPPWLPTRWQTLVDGRRVMRFRVAEYLASLGVDLDRVKAAHFYGGRGRVAIVSGDMLRAHRDQFLFSFTRGQGGKARVHWPEIAGFTNDQIDTLAQATVYVDKEPPAWDDQRYLLAFGGVEVKGVPYARGELRGGTRVYVDGRMVAMVKRNALVESLIAPDRSQPGDPRYPLTAYLRSLGVDAARARAVELIDQDRLVTRLRGRALRELSFAAPPHSQGRVVVHYGAASATVSAVAFYSPRRASARFRRR